MTITDVILKLMELEALHGGDTEVTMWQYAGGLDDLCNVEPVFDTELQRVVIEAKFHDADISR